MSSKSGYLSCAVKTCKNNSKNCKFSFFRFPKNVERAKTWATACSRNDLLSIASSLYNSVRICGNHFEKRMFLNNLKNRLQPHAAPKLNLRGEDEAESQNAMNESIDSPMIEADNSKSPENTREESTDVSTTEVAASKSTENARNESIDSSMLEVDASKTSENAVNQSTDVSRTEVAASKSIECISNMANPMMKVIWNAHAKELTTVCNSFLENECFVDCTIAADGKSLKAHQLILAASSPYFHKLFSEEDEDHPIVIFTDTSFPILKLVIEFAYCGKAKIPADQFEEFWKLAASLQIRGLNTLVRKARKSDIDESVLKTALQLPSKVNKSVSEVGSTCASQEDSFPNASKQHHFAASVPGEGCRSASQMVQPGAMVVFRPGSKNISVHNDPKLLAKAGTSAKSGPSYTKIAFLVIKNNKLVSNTNQEESTSQNIVNKMNSERSPACDQDTDQHSYGKKSTDAFGRPVLLIPLQQKQHHLPSGRSSAESKEVDDVESEEFLGAPDLAGDETEEMDEGLESPLDQTCSKAENIPREEEQATQRPSGGESSALEQQELASGEASGSPRTRKRTHDRERPYKCDVCGKAFNQSSNLICHKRIHTGDRPCKCEICGKAFVRIDKLIAHKRTHSGERPFQCDVCGKSFTQSSNLAHHRRVHTGDRPFKCDVCGKAFKSANVLTCHKRIHSGERPYKCEVCGNAYRKSNNLKYHMNLHTGERPYQCDVCGKSFTWSSALTLHLRKHTGERPYQCGVCGRAFANASNHARHALLHTGERPYACEACGKRFVTSTHYLAHQRVHAHAGDTPAAAAPDLAAPQRAHPCGVCGKAFQSAGHLRAHRRVHAGK